MFKRPPPKRLITGAILLLLIPTAVQSSEKFGFDWELFGKEMGIDIDAESFEAFQQEMMLGRQPYDIYINNTLIGEATADISVNEADPDSLTIALPAKVFQKLPLKREALHELYELDPETFRSDYEQFLPGVVIELDDTSQCIRISVPQIYEDHKQRRLMPPKLWDYGVPGLRINYTLDTSMNRQHGEETSRSFGSVDSQFNWGRWRFLARGNWEKSSGEASVFDFYERHLTTLLPDWHAGLNVGEFTSQSRYMGGLPIVGINLFEDSNQIESADQAYVPLVTGYANSAAVVTVRQRGRVLRSTDVSPGPFEFDDIRVIGNSGNLEVEVKEYSGRTQTYIVPFTVDTRLLKDNRLSWSLSAGRFDNGQSDEHPWLVEASLGYGLPVGGITLYGGLVQSRDFGQYLAGSAFDVGRIGSLALQFETTVEDVGRERRGSVAELSWHKYFELSESDIDLTYRRTIDGNLGSLAAVVGHDDRFESDTIYESDEFVRDEISLSMSKTIGQFGNLAGSLFYRNSNLGRQSASVNTTWSTQVSDYTLSLQGQFSREESDLHEARDDWQIVLSVDIPLSHFIPSGSPLSGDVLGLQTTVEPDGRYGNQVDLSTTLDDEARWTLDLIGTQGKNDDGSLNADLHYDNDSFSASLRAGTARDLQTYGASVNGSLVATGQWLQLSQNVYGNLAGVHVPGADRARISNTNQEGEHLVISGIGNFTPYRIVLDPDSLPPNLTVMGGLEREVIPANDAILSIEFQTFKGEQAVFTITDDQGRRLPYSSLVSVVDAPVELDDAVTDELGQAYFTAVPREGTLEARWRSHGEVHSCRIPYRLTDQLEDEYDIHRISLSCPAPEPSDDASEKR